MTGRKFWRCQAGASTGLGVEELLGVQGGHAAKSRRCDRLAVDVVSHIPGGKHAFHAGVSGLTFDSRTNLDVAAFHSQLLVENLGVWLVANGNEDPGDVQLPNALILGRAK